MRKQVPNKTPFGKTQAHKKSSHVTCNSTKEQRLTDLLPNRKRAHTVYTVADQTTKRKGENHTKLNN